MNKTKTTKAIPTPIRAKKRWGQNFLVDANIARKILDCARIEAGERVLEIGPGTGFLTKGLLGKGAYVTAIEIDPDLVKLIQSESDTCQTADFQNLTLIQGDALRYPYHKITAHYKVIANLPYYISTPLLFRLIEEKTRITQMVLMLQKEVAQRMVAAVGGKSYGALSIIVQFYTDIKLAFTVSPGCFRPKPKVSSAVVSISLRETPRIRVKDETLFIRIVKGAFLYRRKRISNALICAGFPEAQVNTALQKVDYDPARRGETFTIEEFGSLADTMFDYIKRL